MNKSGGLRSCAKLRSFGKHFVTDVSGQHIGPIFKDQAVKENMSRI